MKPREFLKTSVAATGAAALASTLNLSAAEPAEGAGREFYELRLYHLRRGPKQKLFDDFCKEILQQQVQQAAVKMLASDPGFRRSA